ncbi:hypothetical protein MKW94_009893 [Papaver nudicaule]|uniref:Uncharacterized protein n=1 Tax=Papaver nudicaule TaxID=74823 RepID=A0AA42AZW4_PAPNU|nr:hypothetical protein [Papaver nudicaule]
MEPDITNFDKLEVVDAKPLRCLPPGVSPFGGTHGVPSSNPQFPVQTPKVRVSKTPPPPDSANSKQSNGEKQQRPTKKVKISEEVRLLSLEGDRDSVSKVLMKFDALRRRIAQIEPDPMKRPDLKVGTIMMNNGLRTNTRKRIGSVAGVDVGDIFFFRIELCMVGLHTQTMAGIDYMNMVSEQVQQPVAVSIVSSGGYEDDDGDGKVLVYTGQGSNVSVDQKLEGGNLALERSLHRGNEVRVIRGVKNVEAQKSKVYIYDGLYKVEKWWTDKSKMGAAVFKYKLVRIPGQREAFTIWKSIQTWRDNIGCRPGLLLLDITSGAEKVPVSLINEIDGDKRTPRFIYFKGLKFSKTMEASVGCSCQGTCLPGSNCSCIQANGGETPHANGVLVIQKSVVHECGPSCSCYPDCSNQVSQNGLKVRLEVFKTKEKGWGLRSWDPIRAGTFICEYAGEVIDTADKGADLDDEYTFNATNAGDYSSEWNYVPELIEEENPVDLDEKIKPSSPIIISAKNMGNVARFMNHSCSPNVFWQLVLHGPNKNSFPHIMFYAIKHIPPMTELTYDYAKCGKKKQCFCGSANCRSYFGQE